jgi:hypothetical protein
MPKTLRITLHRSERADEDVHLLRRVHRLLADQNGHDRFIIRLTGGPANTVELAFPNDTTAYGEGLSRELADAVGSDRVRVEVIA